MKKFHLSIKALNLVSGLFFLFAVVIFFYIFPKIEETHRGQLILSLPPNWIYLMLILTGLIANWKSISFWSWTIYFAAIVSSCLFGFFSNKVYFYYSIPFVLIIPNHQSPPINHLFINNPLLFNKPT